MSSKNNKKSKNSALEEKKTNIVPVT